jgi:8-oxo-dGTP diphosphatase
MYTYAYPRPALTVDAIVVAGEPGNYWLLLIERKKEPFIGRWALPGGFVDMDETLEHACIRELKEETGLELETMKQFRVFDAIGRDPRHRTISVVFYAFISEKQAVTGSDDAEKAEWFPLDKLPPLAFDHSEIMELFLSKIMQRFGAGTKK